MSSSRTGSTATSRAPTSRTLAGAPQGRGSGRNRGTATGIRPQSGDAELRAQWMAPIIASAHEPGVIYAGYQFVYRSADRGASWERISPDLTSNDPARMLLKSSSAIPFQTITALAESPRRQGLLYAGTDDGKLHVTRDGGKTWTELDGAGADPQVVLACGAVAARRRRGLRHAARPRGRRLRGLCLQVHGFRQDVHQPCRQHPGRVGECPTRGSGQTRTFSTWAPTSVHW